MKRVKGGTDTEGEKMWVSFTQYANIPSLFSRVCILAEWTCSA